MTSEIEALKDALDREQQARYVAEKLLEDKSNRLRVAEAWMQREAGISNAGHRQLERFQKMATVCQLTAGIAHEINNPVGFLTCNVQSLEDYFRVYHSLLSRYEALVVAQEAHDDAASHRLKTEIEQIRNTEEVDDIIGDVDELLQESNEGLRLLRDIVRNVADFSQPDDDEPQLANLNEELEATLRIAWNELKYKCDVRRNFGEIPKLCCFPRALNQVFLNLLLNAAHAIEQRGIVSITTEATAADIVVRISDTGCGIAAEHLPGIFERPCGPSRAEEQFGAGLLVSHQIVRRHHGCMSVDTEVGEGATFTVCLPIAGVDAAQVSDSVDAELAIIR